MAPQVPFAVPQVPLSLPFWLLQCNEQEVPACEGRGDWVWVGGSRLHWAPAVLSLTQTPHPLLGLGRWSVDG